MIKSIWKITKPLIVALIGVYLANKFNIFSFISFIPADKSFDVCITAYFAILEIALELLITIIRNKFMSELSVILSLSNTEVSLDSTPVISFNRSDLAEATITVQINGRKKHFSNYQLILSNAGFVTMQANIHDREASVDNLGNYIINIEKMFGTIDAKTNISYSFRITFARECCDYERSIEIFPELKSKKCGNLHPCIVFNRNKAVLKVER